jgi:hypothetical protein
VDVRAAEARAREQRSSSTRRSRRKQRRGLDMQRKTGGDGKLALMASQQVKRATELQNLEVRAESNRRVRECERKCFASSRLGSIPQACARARQ